MISDEVPSSEYITDYDRAHFVTYLRLLDAQAAGAAESDMARVILDIDPAKEPSRAKIAVGSHLRRAQWMTTHGYRQLLRE